jgi:hypothetical protein
MRDCPNKRVLIIRDEGEYSSASDFDEATYAMLAADVSGHEEEHVAADAADKYLSLVVQRVLSTQVAPPEQNQRHNLFHTKGVVQERSIRIIVDGGELQQLGKHRPGGEACSSNSPTSPSLPHPMAQPGW